jgi:hypothetical protein
LKCNIYHQFSFKVDGLLYESPLDAGADYRNHGLE